MIFACRNHGIRVAVRQLAAAVGAASVLAVCAGESAAAQVPGLPVLQNAFSAPGFALAADFGGGNGQGVYGAAFAWGLGKTGAISISGAAAAQSANGATRGAYGGRLAARLWSGGGTGLGLAAFAGVGGAPRTRENLIVTNPAELIVPAGLSVGYHRSLGSTRGVAVYVAPFYRYERAESEIVETTSAFRASAGLDIALSPTIGLTIGGEFGGSSGDNNGSPAGAFGAAISVVLGGGGR